MATYDVDLFVIGAGSGGVRAARISGGLGARVAVAEMGPLGGTCVNLGCVPKKLYVYASRFADAFEDAAGFGWTVGEREHVWKALRDNKDAEISRLNGIYQRLLDGAGVEVVRGRATVVDPHTVEVAGRRITAARILVATGGRPWVPDVPGRELGVVSDDLFRMDRLPERIVIVGGGYVAVEFGGIFASLGAQVSVVARGPRVLQGFDAELGDFLGEQMRQRGLGMHLGRRVERVTLSDDGSRRVALDDGTAIAADLVLWATGREPQVSGLGLPEIGVRLGPRGEVVVDERWRTSVDSVYALGDVTGGYALTPVATAEGHAFALQHFGGEAEREVDYFAVPTAIFSQPEVATVGLPEERARHKGFDVAVYTSSFRALKHTLSGRQERTLLKLVVDAESDRVLGAHMVGEHAGEILQGLAVAIKAGATKAVFDRTIGIHPTTAEEFVTMRTRTR